jgi:hypothetical protein
MIAAYLNAVLDPCRGNRMVAHSSALNCVGNGSLKAALRAETSLSRAKKTPESLKSDGQNTGSGGFFGDGRI